MAAKALAIDSPLAMRKWAKCLCFLALAFTISWAMWWPILDDLSGFDGDPRSISPVYFAWLSLGAAGPSISAAITVFVFDGPTALARLLSRIVLWQVPLGWYAFALLLVPFSDLVARLLFSWISPIGIELDFSNARTLLLVVPFAFVSGAFAEELGWRGFFQPTLREDLSLLATGVVIGVVWALWHTPLFFTQVGSFVSGTGPTAQSVLFYLAFSILLSWCMAWQGEYTRQSVFLAYLFHVSVNLAIGPVLMPPTSPDAQAQLILLSSAVLFFAFVGVKCFHRKAAGAA